MLSTEQSFRLGRYISFYVTRVASFCYIYGSTAVLHLQTSFFMWDMRFSQQQKFKSFKSSRMLHHVGRYRVTNILEDHSTFNFWIVVQPRSHSSWLDHLTLKLALWSSDTWVVTTCRFLHVATNPGDLNRQFHYTADLIPTLRVSLI
jgi:hypothetical protein